MDGRPDCRSVLIRSGPWSGFRSGFLFGPVRGPDFGPIFLLVRYEIFGPTIFPVPGRIFGPNSVQLTGPGSTSDQIPDHRPDRTHINRTHIKIRTVSDIRYGPVIHDHMFPMIYLGLIPRRYQFLKCTQRYDCKMFPGYFEPQRIDGDLSFYIT